MERSKEFIHPDSLTERNTREIFSKETVEKKRELREKSQRLIEIYEQALGVLNQKHLSYISRDLELAWPTSNLDKDPDLEELLAIHTHTAQITEVLVKYGLAPLYKEAQLLGEEILHSDSFSYFDEMMTRGSLDQETRSVLPVKIGPSFGEHFVLKTKIRDLSLGAKELKQFISLIEEGAK